MKTPRTYGLFEKKDGKWVRLYENLSGSLANCRRLFQSSLLEGSMTGVERRLRPLNTERGA